MKVKVLALMILIAFLSLDVAGHENEEHVADDSQKHVVDDSQKEFYDIIKTCLSQSEETDACYVKGCKNESKYLCAEKVVEAAVLISGPEKAMEVLRDVKESPLFGLKTNGHLLAHIIGRSISKYLGKTGEFFLSCPSDFGYGCQHGFFEIALAEHNDPIKAAESICESLAPSPARDRFCYHGAGHGFMFYENYDLMKALSLCDSFPAQTAQEACWEGVFMENVGGRLKKEPAALHSFKEDDPLAPCSSVESKYREKCYSNHAAYLIHLNNSLENVTNTCLAAGDHVQFCMASIGFMATVFGSQEALAGSFKGSFVETTIHICNGFPAEYVQTCYKTVLKHLVHELNKLNFERSSEFCVAINATLECFKWMSASVLPYNDHYEEVCDLVPDEFKEACLGQKSELLDEGSSPHMDQWEGKRPAFFFKGSLKKIWIIFRASLELIRDEIFFGGLTEEKTIGAPGQVLKPERSQEEEVYSVDAPNKVLEPERSQEEEVYSVDAPNKVLEPERSQEEEVYSVGTPNKVLKPEQDSERLLYDDVFMDEALREYSLNSVTASLGRLGDAKGVGCHIRSHELGRRAYELFGSEIFSRCGGECDAGCKYGVTEAFFYDKGIGDFLDSVSLLCGEEKDFFGLYQCFHRVGHGLIGWFDYDLHRALEVCDLIQDKRHRFSCHTGVFKENVVGAVAVGESESEGYHVTRFLSDDPHYPCNIVDDKYKSACYVPHADRMLVVVGSFQRVGEECAKVSEQFQDHCFLSMGRATFDYLSGDPVKSFEYCGTIRDVRNRNTCLRGVIGDLFWDETHVDRAISFCELDHDPSFQCYDKLINSAVQIIPQSGMESLCNRVPEEYHEMCTEAKSVPASPLSVRNETEPAAGVRKTDSAVIRYANGEYVPSEVHISAGQSVTWINDDQAFWPASDLHPTHAAYPGSNIIKCFTSEKEAIFDACEAKGEGDTYTFTFNTVGSWSFHDHINPRATGTVIVSD